MPTSLWWNHLSDHKLVQWGITRGASQEASLPKGAIKKIKNKNQACTYVYPYLVRVIVHLKILNLNFFLNRKYAQAKNPDMYNHNIYKVMVMEL